MNKTMFILFLFLFPFYLSADQSDTEILSEISATQMKIGQKVRLLTSISDFKEVDVLWEEMIISHLNIEVLDNRVFQANEMLNFEIIFTSFKPGNYENFFITIPIMTKDGTLLYLETKKYTLTIEAPLTPEEIEVFENIKDSSQVELKPIKRQANISFQFSGFILFILFLLVFIFICMLLFYFLYKKIIMKRLTNQNDQELHLNGWERFIYRLEKIKFQPDDNRIEIEIKLSLLTEILKELVFFDFEFNAPAETTAEFLLSLKENHIDSKLIAKINHLFKEMDMIKFARVEVNQQNLEYYYNYIKDLGYEFHQYYLSKKEQTIVNQSRNSDSMEGAG